MIGGPELVTLSGDSCGDAGAPQDRPDDLLCQADSAGYLRLGVTFPVEPVNLGDELGDVHLRPGAASYAAHGAPPPMPENSDRTFMPMPPVACACRGRRRAGRTSPPRPGRTGNGRCRPPACGSTAAPPTRPAPAPSAGPSRAEPRPPRPASQLQP